MPSDVTDPAGPPDEPTFDADWIFGVLERHGVELLLVGGLAARLHGATRRTVDFDCVPDTTFEHLERRAGALRELNARMRVGRMTDEEASTTSLASKEFADRPKDREGVPELRELLRRRQGA